MRKIDQVRKALIAAGFARVHVQEHDEQGVLRTSVERWMHFSKIGEDTRAPLMLLHVTGTDYEEIDVFRSMTQENSVQAVCAAITGARA